MTLPYARSTAIPMPWTNDMATSSERRSTEVEEDELDAMESGGWDGGVDHAPPRAGTPAGGNAERAYREALGARMLDQLRHSFAGPAPAPTQALAPAPAPAPRLDSAPPTSWAPHPAQAGAFSWPTSPYCQQCLPQAFPAYGGSFPTVSPYSFQAPFHMPFQALPFSSFSAMGMAGSNVLSGGMGLALGLGLGGLASGIGAYLGGAVGALAGFGGFGGLSGFSGFGGFGGFGGFDGNPFTPW